MLFDTKYLALRHSSSSQASNSRPASSLRHFRPSGTGTAATMLITTPIIAAVAASFLGHGVNAVDLSDVRRSLEAAGIDTRIRIPDDLPDGSYSLSFGINETTGFSNFVYLGAMGANLTRSPQIRRNSAATMKGKEPRDAAFQITDIIHCDNPNTAGNSAPGAQSEFVKHFRDTWINALTAVWTKVGTSRTYICNYHVLHDQPIDTTRYDASLKVLDRICGNGISGWVRIPDGPKLSFGRQCSRTRFCF